MNYNPRKMFLAILVWLAQELKAKAIKLFGSPAKTPTTATAGEVGGVAEPDVIHGNGDVKVRLFLSLSLLSINVSISMIFLYLSLLFIPLFSHFLP